MREILFRGKRIDNGMWVYGSYLAHKEYMECVGGDKPAPVRHLILYDGCADWDMPITIEYCEVESKGWHDAWVVRRELCRAMWAVLTWILRRDK